MLQRNHFQKKSDIPAFDINEDWDLIRASFLYAYHIRLEKLPLGDLRYIDFRAYLSNLPADAQLSKAIQIRLIKDKDIDTLSDEQKEYRQAWIDRWQTQIDKNRTVKQRRMAFLNALFKK